MDKKIKVVSKKDAEKEDMRYWKGKCPGERLDAVQYLRMQWVEKFHKRQEYNESRKGLRRFYKIVKRK